MTQALNIILPTIRFLPVTRDIVHHLIGAVEDTEDVHLTIADGQEDDQKREMILTKAERLARDGRFTYIGLKDATQRLLRATQLETEWILPLSDDDPYSVNLIRGAYGMSRTVSSDTMAISPYAYLSYSPTQLNLFRLQDIEEEEQGARLLSLYKQAHLNGILTWSIIRRKPFLEWMEFLRTKTIWPTYADQLLVSYLAMKGKIVASKEKYFFGKDERDWHDPRRAIIKDSGSYPNKFLTLFHEIFWISDLFTLLRSHGLEDAAVPSLTFRAAALLAAGVSVFEDRLRVLEIEKSRESEDAYSLIVSLASYVNALGKAPVDEHIRFFMQVQPLSQTLGVSPIEATSPTHTMLRKTESCTASTRPMVSVIVPCFNHAKFLPDAVESVAHQTFTDWECIIVNDGSPDQTSQVARDLIARYPGKRIRLLEKKNGGLADARNAGIAASHGSYILPLDADDVLKPYALARLVEALETQSDVAIVYPDYETFGTQSCVVRCIDEHLFLDAARLKNGLPSCSGLPYCSLYRRNVWSKVGGYNPNMIWGYEDWDFWIGCLEKGFRARRVPEPLFLYRVKPGSMYSNALQHDAELKARIILNHSALFDEAVRQKAETVLQTPVTSGLSAGERPPKAIPADAQPTAAPSPPEAPDSKWPPEVTAHVRQAEDHLLKGDLPAVRDALREALVIVPRDPQLIIAYGNIVLRLRDVEGARREFVKAATLHPNHSSAHLNLAAVLVMLERRDEAECSVRQALTLNPNDVDALKLLGRICLESGRHVEGVQTYAGALRQSPDDVETLLVLGKCAVEVSDLATAQTMYERALKIAPDNDLARENLGIVMERVSTEGAGGEPAAFEQVPQPPSPYQRTEPLRGSSHKPDRMRLLLVVHGFPPKQIGGTELYAYALAKELQRRGHAVRVLCPEYGSNQAEGTITHGVCDGLDVARIQVTRGDFISQFNNERLLPALRRYAVEFAVDLVHIHHLIGISASAPRVFAEHGVPMVMTMHDEWLLCPQCHFLQPDGTFCKDGPETVDKCVRCLVGRLAQSAQPERLPQIFYALALRKQVLQKTVGLIDTFIVPSQFIGEELRRHGGDHPRIVLSPLGLPPLRPLSWRPSTDRLRFTFLGSIYFTKGLDLAIRAFNLTDPNKARLDLYGQAPDAVYFSEAMSYVKPGHQVKYHGPYSAADLPSILAGTDIAVIPSRSENYPCVVRESLHAGVPVIAPNVGGVPEIIRDGENGLLFEPGDYEDLARKLCFFVNSPNRVMTFRERVRPVRTISEDADQLEAIYRDALARRSDAGAVQVAAAPTSLDGISAWLRRADERAAEGDWVAASDALKEAHAQVPDDPQVIVAHGNVLLRLGDVEGARREFVKATALSPEYAPAFGNLAAVLLHLGRAEEAEASVRRALALNPADTDALKVLARVCLDSERYTEAVQAYVTVLREHPDDLETLLIVGNCYAEAGRPEDAKTFYQRVLQLDPGNAVAAENLAVVNGKEPAPDRSISTESEASAREPVQVSIIIPVFNRLDLTRQCLESIRRTSQVGQYEIVVVDNGSTDGTTDFLRQQQQAGHLRAVFNADNRGFAGACNQGARAAPRPYLLFLNNDTEVQSGWFEPLVAVLDADPAAAAVGSKLLCPDGTLQHAGVIIVDDQKKPQGLTPSHIYYRQMAHLPEANQPRTYQALTAACLLVRRTAFEQVGGFDENYWNGYEDVDFCFKLQNLGWRLVYEPKSIVIHYESQSGPERFQQESRNVERLRQIWSGKVMPDFVIKPDGTCVQTDAGRVMAYSPPSLSSLGAAETPTIRAEPIASIVIVTYNSARTIRACLESVFSSTRSPIDLIVVDNASTDATRAIIAEYQGRITALLNAENAGFSRGCNRGIRASAGQHVVLLNPDTVVTSGWLDRLLSHVTSGVGAVGPISDYVAGLQKFHLYLPVHRPATMTLPELADLLSGVNHGMAVETRLLIGFCMMIPRRVLDETGLLDEDLFLGNDDLDLSWRLRLKGYKLLVATDAFVHHKGQVSFKSEAETKTSRLVQESTDRLYAKLEAHYGKGNVPPPMELWGVDWFKPTRVDFRSKGQVAGEKLTSIIILTHNGLEHTKKCLASIEAHTPEPYELIIVDNGSTDGTLDYLRDYMAMHNHVRVIANLTNLGFAAGNNQGLAQARGDYVMLLNNDTIVTTGWLRRMLHVFKAHPDVGIVGPMSNYVSGSQLVRDASYKGPEGLEAFATEWARDHDGQSAEATRVVGFCLLTRKEVIARIGGLDEQFGSGNYEDDDFCIRAFQVGFRARIALDVFIHHTGSQTFKAAKIDYRQSLMRNWELFKAKWGIPADAPYEKGYRFPPQTAQGSDLSIPLPDVGADHRCEDQGCWWQEISERPGRSQPAVTEEAPLSVVIVSNGQGLMPLWPSLVQHTKHPLVITVLPSNGNGNGADPAHEAACPSGWQIGTSDLPTVRLLNQLLESVHDDPVILLSSDLILTPGWLKRLLAAFDRDRRIAVIGPTLNQGPATQRVKADYKGTGKALRQFGLRRAHRYGGELTEVDSLAPFCIIFKPSACQPTGPFREDLDLLASLGDYFRRLRQASRKVAVALDAYVHYEPHADLPSRGRSPS